VRFAGVGASWKVVEGLGSDMNSLVMVLIEFDLCQWLLRITSRGK
jgi:hypothetical protein